MLDRCLNIDDTAVFIKYHSQDVFYASNIKYAYVHKHSDAGKSPLHFQGSRQFCKFYYIIFYI